MHFGVISAKITTLKVLNSAAFMAWENGRNDGALGHLQEAAVLADEIRSGIEEMRDDLGRQPASADPRRPR